LEKKGGKEVGDPGDLGLEPLISSGLGRVSMSHKALCPLARAQAGRRFRPFADRKALENSRHLLTKTLTECTEFLNFSPDRKKIAAIALNSP